jgi:hypothetical protein
VQSDRSADPIRPEIRARVGSGVPMTLAEYLRTPANQWEREAMQRVLDDDSLIRILRENILPNCRGKRMGPQAPCSTYDEAVVHHFMPEVLDRLSKKGGQ